jgi:hypothetical protein
MDPLLDADPDGRIPFHRQDNVEAAAVRNEDFGFLGRLDQEGNDLGSNDVGELLPGQIWVDRRDREHVAYYQGADGRWRPTHLKRGDHVIAGGMPMVVVGPGSGRTTFLGYYAPWFGDMVLPIDVMHVSDRVPADASELAMPVIPEEEVAP